MIGHPLLHRSVALHRPRPFFPNGSFSADTSSIDSASSFFSRRLSSSSARNRAAPETVRPPLPDVKGRIADPLLPAQVGGLHASLMLPQHANDLILANRLRRITRLQLTS